MSKEKCNCEKYGVSAYKHHECNPVEVQINGTDPATINIGCNQPIKIDKMFGPTIFMSLRITADMQQGWVIERATGIEHEYVEWCIIPAQLPIDFPCENCHEVVCSAKYEKNDTDFCSEKCRDTHKF
jgi:hypothetical protein